MRDIKQKYYGIVRHSFVCIESFWPISPSAKIYVQIKSKVEKLTNKQLRKILPTCEKNRTSFQK